MAEVKIGTDSGADRKSKCGTMGCVGCLLAARGVALDGGIADV
jgi:hypothetical protein